MAAVIECRALTKRYRGTTALAGLDLTVEAGQVFGFLGPNGAGKTTTLRILLGLVTATSGQAWLNGKRVPDPTGLARVGAMIEEPTFYPWLTGRRNLDLLALSGAQLPARGEAVAAALDRAGLAGVADRKVKGYSQGMRQRLGLAAALLRRPALLLLDEPFSGVDTPTRRALGAHIEALAARGVSIVIATHHTSEWPRCVTHELELAAGGSRYCGPVRSRGGAPAAAAPAAERAAARRALWQ